MQKIKLQKPNSLVQLFCPLLLELALATAILNYPQFLQSAQAQNSPQKQSIFLSQSSNGISTWHDVLYDRGNQHFESKRYQEAFNDYDAASKLSPTNHIYWYKRGLALANLGRYQDAVNSYDRASKINPDDARVWSNRGIAFYRQEGYQDALKSFDKALQLKSDDHGILNWKGNALRELERYPEAVNTYKQAIQLQSVNPNYLYNLSLALDRQKLYDEALKALLKANLLRPNNLYLYDRARLLVKLNKPDEALYFLGNLLSSISKADNQLIIEPSDLGEAKGKRIKISRVLHLRGVAFLESGKFLQALESFNDAINLNAYSFESRVNGELVKIDNDLGSHDSWYGKGATLVKLERYREALNAFNKAIELKPDFTSAIDARNKLSVFRLMSK